MSTAQRDIPVANIIVDASGLPSGGIPEGTFTGLRFLGPGAPTFTDEGMFAGMTFPSRGGLGADVPNLAALTAVNDTAEPNNNQRLVVTLLQSFQLDKTSTATVDGISVVATLSGIGRWLRILTHVPRWTQQTTWGVDYTGAGNDQNSGADSAGNRLASLAELCRRLRVVNFPSYTVNIIGNIPVTDTFRMSPTIAPELTAAGVRDLVFNLNGVRTPIVTSAVTAATATVGNVQATITDAAVTWATHIGKLIVITSGASIGAVATVLKDLGAGVARVSQWWNTTTTLPVAAPAPGDGYTINDRTQCPMILPCAGHPERFSLTIRDIDFTGQCTLRGQVSLITTRHSGPGAAFGSLAAREASFVSANGCSIHFPAPMASQNIAAFFGAILLFSGCAFINVRLNSTDQADFRLFNCVSQDGECILGFSSPVVGASQAGAFGKMFIQGTFGMGIFDAPAGSNGLTVRRNGIVGVSGPLYGSGNALFGAAVFEGGSLMIAPAITPTLTGASGELQLEGTTTALQALESVTPGIQAGTGTLVAGTVSIPAVLNATSRIKVSMKDPGAGAITGFAAFETPAASRVVGAPGSFVVNAITDAKALIATAISTFDWEVANDPPIGVPLSTWAGWAAAIVPHVSGFGRNVVSYKTGARVSDMTGTG